MAGRPDGNRLLMSNSWLIPKESGTAKVARGWLLETPQSGKVFGW
jgi:hypothetical protein